MSSERIPALAVAVVSRERVLYARGFGTTAEDDTGRPVTHETLFRIGSTTKPLTALLVMRLVDEGLLELDAPLTAYVPELRLSVPGASERVTVRSLLSHRSGLPSGGEELGHLGPGALAAFARDTLPGYELVAPPGLLFSYSNPGYSLLGHVAERVTGERFGVLMEERVFAPLGMTRSFFDPLVALTYPLALPHRLEADGALTPVHRFFDEPAAWPAGFVMSNAVDLARFAQALLDAAGGGGLLRGDGVREMFRPQADLLTADGGAYGLGFFLRTYKGVALAEHGGSIPTYECSFSLAPEEGVALIALANRPHTGAVAALAHHVFDEFLSLDEVPRRPAFEAAGEVNLAEFEAVVGDYVGKRRGLVRLLVDENVPWMELNGRRLRLRGVRPDVYVGEFPGGRARVSLGVARDGAGPVRFVLLEGTVCERAELGQVEPPTAEALSRLAGRYEGFDVIEVEFEEGLLQIASQMHGERRMACLPLGGLRFASDYGVMEFVEDAAGNVTELEVWDQFPLARTPPR